MKKLFVIALIAFLAMTGACLAAGPTGPNYSGDILGQSKYQGDPHRIYRLVHVASVNNDTDGIAEGSVVVWDDILDDGVSVETTTTSGDGRVAGVLVTTTVSNDTVALSYRTASDDAGSNANWGWLQTYGKASVSPTAAAAVGTTVGASVCAGGTAGSVTDYNAKLSTSNSGILGCALDTAAISASADIFITCD